MYAILSTRAKTKGKKKLARQALSHTPHNPNHLTHSANELELNTQLVMACLQACLLACNVPRINKLPL